MGSKDQPFIDRFATPFVSTDIVRLRILNLEDIGEFIAVLSNLQPEGRQFLNEVLRCIFIGWISLSSPSIVVSSLPIDQIECIGRVGNFVKPIVDSSAVQ